MEYQLGRQLKEAGFKNPSSDWKGKFRWIDNSPDVVYIPTLPELIEACLEKQPNKYSNFYFNHIFVEADGGYIWEAYFDGGINPKNDYYESGKTPEEAVAKLYISLNKKGNDLR